MKRASGHVAFPKADQGHSPLVGEGSPPPAPSPIEGEGTKKVHRAKMMDYGI
jgi:hypothetical protein